MEKVLTTIFAGIYYAAKWVERTFVILSLRIRGAQLSPKGEYEYKYLESIVNGTYTEDRRVDAYEQDIQQMIDKTDGELTREEAAWELYQALNMIIGKRRE